MATEKILSKEEKISKETKRLKKIFKDIDKNKLNTVNSLIENTAFMTVTLEELQAEINKTGFSITYQNGENQHGTKKSPCIDIYISMSKNHTANMKILIDLVPLEKRKDSKLEAFRKSFE